MTLVMFDTVTLSTLPPFPQAVAGYVGGFWPTWSPECQKYPNLVKQGRVLSIAVNAEEDADCLDCERGDATPAECPAWVKRQKARGIALPVIYASLSQMMEVLTTLGAVGIKRTDIKLWSAHYNGRAHICNPSCGFGFNTTADATQWTSTADGRNLDQSLCQDNFFAGVTTVQNLNHYERFTNTNYLLFGKKLNETVLVRQYDKYRALQTPNNHPHRVQLALLRKGLDLLAKRVAKQALSQQDRNGKPSWDRFYRGWRFQQLIHRAQGARVAQ